MNSRARELATHKNNNLQGERNKVFLFYMFEGGGTSTIEIETSHADIIQSGDYYKDKDNNYLILGKQYDDKGNIILLCENI